jgi:homoaconitate hydratase
LCGLYNHDECLNAAVEFTGPGVASLSMDARLSISNMTTEWGPLVGWFPVDAVTIKYLRGVHQRLKAMGVRAFHRKRHCRLGESSRAGCGCRLCGADYARSRPSDAACFRTRYGAGDAVAGGDRAKKVAIQKAYLISCVNSRLEDLAAAANVLKGKKVASGVKFYLSAASKWVQEEAEKRGIWQTLMDAGAQPLPSGCGPCIGLGVGLLEAGEVGISATNRNFKGRMGSRDAKCYLASPEVVAASAVAGYIRGPHEFANREPQRVYTELTAASGGAEKVEILPGFPQRVQGRLVFMPQDNVNTDAIYGKDYTYRDDMTPEMMAKVVMENYDPQFAARTKAGDVIVSQFNFGTGSSREQAVTCLKAKGIPLVIAASFSQTYLRNAFNNGFLCIEVPEFVARVREQFAKEIAAKEKTIIPGDEIDIDFTSSTIGWRGEKFTFPALGSVPQSLVIAGGVENLVAKRLGVA